MIRGLQVSGFRNLETQSFAPGSGSNLLLGGTGSGKTSLLEAAYLATTTRSFRTSRLRDCLRSDGRESAFSVVAEVETSSRSQLGVGWSSEGFWRRLNGETVALSEHLAAQPILAWTSAETEVLTGEPELRRRFVDRGVVGERPAALETLQRLRKVLGQKRSLLSTSRHGRPQDLESWNDLLAQSIHRVACERHSHCERLSAALGEVATECELGFPQLSVSYRPSPRVALESYDAVLAALSAKAADEVARQRCLLGSHRDRIEILWSDRAVGRVASAGERKAVGLCLLAAQSRLLEQAGRPPLLLLDDLDTELDRRTFYRVWSAFSKLDQVFASSNRPEVWEDLPIACRWAVAAGRVEAP
ncbi:MAG: DNA replication and repair protein RecF [Acidobacteriota bacterium]